MEEQSLIHDWNKPGSGFDWANANVQLDDETLRDGLQNPSVVDPSIEVRCVADSLDDRAEGAHLLCRHSCGQHDSGDQRRERAQERRHERSVDLVDHRERLVLLARRLD